MSSDLISEHIGSLNSLITSKSKTNKKKEIQAKANKSVTNNKRTYIDEARISLKKDDIKLKKVKNYYSNSVPSKKSNKKIKLLDKIMHKS